MHKKICNNNNRVLIKAKKELKWVSHPFLEIRSDSWRQLFLLLYHKSNLLNQVSSNGCFYMINQILLWMDANKSKMDASGWERFFLPVAKKREITSVQQTLKVITNTCQILYKPLSHFFFCLNLRSRSYFFFLLIINERPIETEVPFIFFFFKNCSSVHANKNM